MPDLTVTYESGVLKPATPLAFPEGQTLQIRILEPTSPAPINQAAIDLLRTWREADNDDEQKETWEFLHQALDRVT